MERATESLIPRPLYSTPVTISLLFLSGLVSSLTILLCFFWLTSRLDDVQTEGAVSLTNVVLTETLDTLDTTVRDFSFWTLAYDVVQLRQDDEVANILGSSATESDLFDQMLILSRDGDVLYDFQATGSDVLTGTETLPHLTDYLDRLGSVTQDGFNSVSGFARLGDMHAAISVAYIVPEDHGDLTPGQYPIMVGISHLNTAWMDSLSRHAGQTGYGTGMVLSGRDTASLPLIGLDGAPEGYLAWDRSTVGSDLRAELQTLILSICIGILVISMLAARFFNAQHTSLRQLRALAATDQLTGILNRAGLDQITRSDETTQSIASGEAALIYVDLNDFKKLNDDLGHEAGDKALQIMANTLREAVRDQDIVARMGGDEFVCLIQDKDPRRASKVVTERIQTLTNDPVSVAGVCVTVNPSIGVAVASRGLMWDTLLSQADAAMYTAKRSGSLKANFAAEGAG